MLNNAILNKKLVPIIELFIDSLYETDEDERHQICEESFGQLEDLLEEFNAEADWQTIVDFAEQYIDNNAKEHQLDITPIKQMIAEQIKW